MDQTASAGREDAAGRRATLAGKRSNGPPGTTGSHSQILVDRRRLTDRLLQAPPAAPVVLQAPAGYSKTTTLRAWERADRGQFAWLDIKRRHDDPAKLIRDVAEAIGTVLPIDESAIRAMGMEASHPAAALDRLARVVRGVETPFTLVLDDVHLLESRTAVEILKGLTALLPGRARLALGSRTAPPLPLGRLRANGELLELGPRDLAMTRGESRQLLVSAGLKLSEDNLDLVFERTEGWPAALHLAALTLTGRSDLDRAVADFAGDDRAVVEYLQEEFLSVTPPDAVDFMTRTSVLGELTGPACDAALERSGSSRVLRELARSNALIIPLDRRDERFRYHHLLREMLRAELRRGDLGEKRRIQARISRWYASNSEFERAIGYAIEAGDVELAGKLVWSALPELSGQGRFETLNHWLDQIGERQWSTFPRLALTAAHCLVATGFGKRATHWAKVAESQGPVTKSGDSIRAEVCLLKATLAEYGVVQMGSDAAEASGLYEADDSWQSAAHLYLGVSSHLAGETDVAEERLRESVLRAAVFSPPIQTLALAQLGLLAYLNDDRERAVRLLSEARGQIRRCGLANYPVVLLPVAVGSMVWAEEGRLERAGEDLSWAKGLLAGLESMPSWYEAEARLAMCRASVRLEDLNGARSLLSEASVDLAAVPDAGLLNSWRAGIADEIVRLQKNRWSDDLRLTGAELRTLQYLPTHLSFRQIGARNNLSANTIKTQARAIYRKLDASSRAEAVGRAREAGLFNDDPPPTLSRVGADGDPD